MTEQTLSIETFAPRTPLQEFWFYFKQNKGAVIGLTFILAVALISIFAPWIAPVSYTHLCRDFCRNRSCCQYGRTTQSFPYRLCSPWKSEYLCRERAVGFSLVSYVENKCGQNIIIFDRTLCISVILLAIYPLRVLQQPNVG